MEIPMWESRTYVTDKLAQVLASLTTDELAAFGLARLPRDADGVVIREGDRLVGIGREEGHYTVPMRPRFSVAAIDENDRDTDETVWLDPTMVRHIDAPKKTNGVERFRCPACGKAFRYGGEQPSFCPICGTSLTD